MAKVNDDVIKVDGTVIPEFPSNSIVKKPKADATETEDRPRLEKVATAVGTKEKSFGSKLGEAVGATTKSVGAYLWNDILVPAIKNTVADVVTNGITAVLYPNEEDRRRRYSSSKTSYNKYYGSVTRYSYNDDRRIDRAPNIRKKAFEEVILDNRGDAEEVISTLLETIDRYGSATVADLYELVDIAPKYTDHKYGWTNLSSATTQRVSNGYLISLPTPRQLD